MTLVARDVFVSDLARVPELLRKGYRFARLTPGGRFQFSPPTPTPKHEPPRNSGEAVAVDGPTALEQEDDA